MGGWCPRRLTFKHCILVFTVLIVVSALSVRTFFFVDNLTKYISAQLRQTLGLPDPRLLRDL